MIVVVGRENAVNVGRFLGFGSTNYLRQKKERAEESIMPGT